MSGIWIWVYNLIQETLNWRRTHKINILYTYSDNKYKEGYDKLFSIHNDSNINYIKESQNFKNSLLLLLDLNNLHTVFFVDDVVFKNRTYW